MEKVIDFYFDFLSPFAYLANHELSQIARDEGWTIKYHVVDLTVLKRAAGNTGPSNREIPPKIKYLMVDLARWAGRYGIPLEMLKGGNCERINKGTFYAASKGCVPDYVRETYDVVWGAGADPDAETTITEVVKRMDWNKEEFLDFIASDETEQAFTESMNGAIDAGAFGVPIMCIGDEMWWGNDRLAFLRDYIKAAN